MQLYRLAVKRAPALIQVSVAEAFRTHGVTLKYPSRSRSGIRWDDGMVVIAVDTAQVRESAEGFRCLLWAPRHDIGAGDDDSSSAKERLEHCRLAARHGGADGLLVEEGGVVEPDTLLTLYVERRGREYWASWGNIARAHVGAAQVSAGLHDAYVPAAA